MIPEIIHGCFVAVMKIEEITGDRSVNILHLYIIYSEILSVGLKYLAKHTRDHGDSCTITVHISSQGKQIPTQLGWRRDMDRSNLCFPGQGAGIFLWNLFHCHHVHPPTSQGSPPQTLILEKESDHQSFSFSLHHQFQPPDTYSLQLLEWNSSPFDFYRTSKRNLSYLYTTSRELTSPTVSFHLQAPSNLERIHLNKANGSGTHQHHACGTKEPYVACMHEFYSKGHLHITWWWRVQYSISPRFLESYFWHPATLWPLTTPSSWSLPGQSHAWGPKHCMPMKKTLWTCWTVALKYLNSVSS